LRTAGVEAAATGVFFRLEAFIMGAAENKEVVRQMREAKGIDAILATMSDDVRWTLIGTTKFSGVLNGKQEIVEKLFKPIFAQLETPGSNVIDNIIAEGDYVVVQQHGTGRRTKSGKDYNNTYCIVYKVAGGKIKEITEYCDTELVTSAFGR
jgi:ketosteroid isomerase-like protein